MGGSLSDPDAVIIGSGPNGLAAAVTLAQAGARVLVLEAREQIGGGTRTAELTLPGYLHDVCSAVHPMGILSPYLRTLPLEAHGLRWIKPQASVAHPLDDGPAMVLYKSMAETVAQLGRDALAYRHLVQPFLADVEALLAGALAPLGIPDSPFLMARFGLRAVRSAVGLARRFESPHARALVAGCAAHSILPLTQSPTGAFALMFLITAHTEEWPVAAGGSRAVTDSLASLLKSLGGSIQTNTLVTSAKQLPPARVYLFDTSPAQVVKIAADALPSGYVGRLKRYRYGPGVFKMDWALDGSIPWKDDRCKLASTVHLGGTMEEIAAGEAAVWRGEHPSKPYVLLAQQSEFDPSRAPPGKQTGWAYCHVPAGSTVDQTEVIENQIERFAPGFKQRILARHASSPAMLEAENPNYLGGAITGGVTDLLQLFMRPVARLNPYTTPNPRIFICSAATPPGGGVHGMCGHHAAKAALRQLGKAEVEATPL